MPLHDHCGIDRPCRLLPPPTCFGTSRRTRATGSSAIVQAIDPNEKLGAAGYGPQAFITADTTIPYRINFENLGPGTVPTPAQPATAPAQRVEITDQLSTNLDWSTLQFTEFGFGDNAHHRAGGPPVLLRHRPDDLQRPDLRRRGRAELQLRPRARSAPSSSRSTRPPRCRPTCSPASCRPRTAPAVGKGYIAYTVQPKAGLPTGTEIRNVALISFDGQTIIATNQVDPHDPSQGTDPAKEALNTIDAGTPSQPGRCPAGDPGPRSSFTVSWSGQDDTGGSGIASYDVYVSDDGGPFTLFLEGTADTSATFTGDNGHTYAFYSVATDNVGHARARPRRGQVMMMVSTEETTAVTAVSGSGVYGSTATLTASLTGNGLPLVGKALTFHLIAAGNDTIVGTADTNTSGVATLGNVALAGFHAGSFTGIVTARFEGDSGDEASPGAETSSSGLAR